jgi:hypothetical protein
MHVAQKCAAVLGQRHAQNKRPKARRVNPFQREALWGLPPGKEKPVAFSFLPMLQPQVSVMLPQVDCPQGRKRQFGRS